MGGGGGPGCVLSGADVDAGASSITRTDDFASVSAIESLAMNGDDRADEWFGGGCCCSGAGEDGVAMRVAGGPEAMCGAASSLLWVKKRLHAWWKEDASGGRTVGAAWEWRSRRGWTARCMHGWVGQLWFGGHAACGWDAQVAGGSVRHCVRGAGCGGSAGRVVIILGWAYLDWGVMYGCDGELKRLGVTSEALGCAGVRCWAEMAHAWDVRSPVGLALGLRRGAGGC